MTKRHNNFLSLKKRGTKNMHNNALSFQELGKSRLLIYKEDVSNLNFKLNIPHVLPIVRTTFLGSPLCYFDISNLISLHDLQKFMFDKYDLLKVLKTCVQVSIECGRQGIGLDELLFDSDYVFVDAQFNTYFIPIKVQGNTLLEIRSFLKCIICDSRIDPKYTDNFVQLLLNCFNEEDFTLEALMQLIDELLASKSFQIPDNLNMIIEPQNILDDTPKEVENSENDEELSRFLSQHLEEEKQKKMLTPPDVPGKNYPNIINSGFAPVFSTNPSAVDTNTPPSQNNLLYTSDNSNENIQPENPSEPTGATAEYQSPMQEEAVVAHLYSAENPQTPIYINANPFKVGRNPELVEYVINSPYIGRIHAYIEREGNQYYLSDNKSTNGTFLNTYRIPPEQRVPLKNGDIIRFAKHAFQFVWQPENNS